jgi:LuxR family transcriptional regulator, maltose regulon positive regulatory protein
VRHDGAVVATLLASKYRAPRPRATTVARPRLTAGLTAAGLPPLTVVAAPAGFGKTTLLAEWVSTALVDKASVAWLSLDEGDNDVSLFLSYVVSALSTATDVVGSGTLQQLASASPSTEAALANLVNDLHRLPTHLVLVLDDYHLVTAPEVHEAVTFLLEHQPPELHLVLATRADPALPLPRMRARGDLLELRAVDLRFTNEEASAYLNGSMGLALSDDDVAALGGRTEGWIAALQLAALSVQGRDDAGAFIAGFAGDDRYVVDYLAEEVLARQPDGVRDFLLETSVLERLSGPLCDAVTGRDDGSATLVALERANLFLVPLDDRRQWYRYHHLFADVLRAHLRELRPEEEAVLHRRASLWFESDGDTSAAIRHALAGRDHARAADLIERAAPQMSRDRREVELQRWLRSLPDEVVATRPVLAMTLVGTLAQVSDFASVEQGLSEIERSLRRDDGSWPETPPPGFVVVDDHGYRSIPAMLDLYRAAISLSRGDLDGTARHARAALTLQPPGDDFLRAAAGALAGLASWAGGDLAGAHAAYSESVKGLTSVGFVADVLGCTVTLGDIRQTQGRLGDALRSYQRALDMAAATPDTAPLRGAADMHVGMASVLLERGDLPGAAEHLAASQRLGEHLWLPKNAYRSRLVMARLRAAEGDLDSALELLDEAERVYNGDYSPNVQPVPAVRARLRIRRGELGHADAWAAQRELAPDDELSYLREYEHVTYARLLLARHRARPDESTLGDAEGLLVRLLTAAEEGGREGSVIEILVLRSLGCHARRDVPASLAALGRAVKLAEPEGYLRIFADEGPSIAVVLEALLKQGTATGYVRDLLAATIGQRQPVRPAQALVDPLSDRELDVLRLLGSDLDGPDIARELSVSLNTMRTHTKNIYAKLGVTSRRAAVRQAQELKLLPGQRPG